MARRKRQLVALAQRLKFAPPAGTVVALQRPQVIEIAMTLLTAELGEGLRFQLSEGGPPLPHGWP